MIQFQCSLVEDGWMQDYLLKREYIWAEDEKSARAIICKKWGIRKNAHGLKIREAEVTTASKDFTYRKTTVQGEYHYMTGTYSEHIVDVKSYFCTRCHAGCSEHSNQCNNCGAYFQ